MEDYDKRRHGLIYLLTDHSALGSLVFFHFCSLPLGGANCSLGEDEGG